MTTILLSIVAVALFWGGWPLVARGAGEHGIAGALVMSVVSVATVALSTFVTGTPLPPTPALSILGLAGVMMGLGLIAFNAASTSPLVEASTVIPVLDTAMLLVSVIGGIWFFGEEVTTRKIIGVALLVIGILTLKPQG